MNRFSLYIRYLVNGTRNPLEPARGRGGGSPSDASERAKTCERQARKRAQRDGAERSGWGPPGAGPGAGRGGGGGGGGGAGGGGGGGGGGARGPPPAGDPGMEGAR